ncbi:hypothetical protein DD509_02970 [Dehalogenimonas alkenigignens]|uniref:DUF3052 domain-containing protein n=2 Tax=Dehalogenimonas alkenigignens TaxID=1217799 RepID=A0A0W0GHI4_9CHLR|nr:hypothetical protein DEALK_08600 [Dehalogenimonas alkenigignens]PVV84274.1 hypothetical protein DD509_02970 [Dehalogenimonas alkenigignens]
MDNVLSKKMLIKSGFHGAVLSAPPGYIQRLGLMVETGFSGQTGLDFIQAFIKEKNDLPSLVPAIVKALKPEGLLWLTYPKGTSKVDTDLNRDILWAEMANYGLAGVAIISIDDTWSAMRFRPADKVGK